MMRKLIFYIVFLFFTGLTLSCQSRTKKRLYGIWALELDSCIVQERVWNYCSNTIVLNDDMTCKLPSIFDQQLSQSLGTWHVSLNKNKQDSVFFNVPNNPLHGKYAITFYKDYNKMVFKMRLENDSTFLVCGKHILSFSTNNVKKILDSQ
jgi:hypothetical protein